MRRTTVTTLGARARLFLPLRSWRLQVAGAAIAIVAAILSAQSFASAREAVASYLIQPGDTLLAVAATTGVSMDKLMSLNDIKNPDVIIAGQTLSLTGAAPPAAEPAGGPRYSVKSGDTLWAISQSTGAPLDALIQLNNLANADQLAVGQVLRLPATPAAPQQRAAGTGTPRPKATSTSAAARPTPSPASTANPLQQRVATDAARVAGPNAHVGVAATNLVSGEKINFHADDAFPSASVMKLPILVELERQVAAGDVAWTESLRAEASAMIAVSDNTAANQIADLIHPQAVNDTLARLGLAGTRFLNLFADGRNASNPGQNQTTPANMARLLELIATDRIVSPQVSADIRTLLARNADRSKLVRLLPPDARVEHKSGWYEGVANDVGIVTVDRVPTRWVIAVFTENLPDAETGNQTVAVISKVIYDAWAP
jgi:beta-lactamase class A